MTFTGTKDQFIRWLQHEIESRDQRIHALERWWGYRGWTAMRQRARHVVAWPVRLWAAIRPPEY